MWAKSDSRLSSMTPRSRADCTILTVEDSTGMSLMSTCWSRCPAPSYIISIKRAIGPQQNPPQSLDSESVGSPPPPDDRQPSQREWTLSTWDVTAPIQSDIDGSMIDARSPTIGPTMPRSPEMRVSQDGPRDTEKDRPELGPSGDRSRSTEEAVLGNGERRSSRNVDDGLPGHNCIGLLAQTLSRYKCTAAVEPQNFETPWATPTNLNLTSNCPQMLRI